MKKTTYIFIGLLMATSNKPLLAKTDLPGLVRSGQYSTGTLLSITQPDVTQQSLDSVYSVGVYPLYTPELTPGEGREIIQGYCNLCHSVAYITMQPPLSAVIWEDEVYKMINTYGAFIPEDETKKIIAYLQAHYTLETRRQ